MRAGIRQTAQPFVGLVEQDGGRSLHPGFYGCRAHSLLTLVCPFGRHVVPLRFAVIVLELQQGVIWESALKALTRVETETQEVQAGTDERAAYIRWTIFAEEALWSILTPAALGELIFTQRYAALRSGADVQGLSSFISLEMDARRRLLRATTSYVEAQVGFYRGVDRLVVLDTNLFLHHKRPFDQLPLADVIDARAEGVRLVVPLVVIRELDKHKRGNRAVKSRARTTLRRIRELVPTIHHISELGRYERGPLKACVMVSVAMDPPGHVPLADADSELTEAALRVEDRAGRPVTVVTLDGTMQYLAQAADARALLLPQEQDRTVTEDATAAPT